MPAPRTADPVGAVASLRQPQVPVQQPRSSDGRRPGTLVGPPAPPPALRPANDLGHVVIHLRGDVDLDASLQAAADIGAALEAGPTTVAVDLASATSIDACLLHVLAVWRQRCDAAGSLLLVTGSGEVDRGLLALAGPDEVLQPDAVASPV